MIRRRRRGNRRPPPPPKITNRLNEKISAPEVRVVDETGQNLGVKKTPEALDLAREKGLDLIEIVPQAQPPIAKIQSFDKFRYQKEKERKKEQQSQKSKELKQIRITPRAAENDLQMKARRVEKFLTEEHKVEINLFLRGREKANKEWGLKKLEEFLTKIQVPFQVTMTPKRGGRGFITQIYGQKELQQKNQSNEDRQDQKAGNGS